MKTLLPLLILLTTFTTIAQPKILPERERAEVIDEILEDKMTNLLPKLMRKEGIDMWILISREYNEDPVMKTMLFSPKNISQKLPSFPKN